MSAPDPLPRATSDLRLRVVAGCLVLERRSALLFGLAGGLALIAALAAAAPALAAQRSWTLTAAEGLALQVLLGVAAVGSALTLGAAIQRRRTRLVALIDAPRGVMRTRRRTINLASISQVHLTAQLVGGAERLGIAIEVGGERIPLLGPQPARQGPIVLAMVASIHQALAAAGAPISDDVRPAPDRHLEGDTIVGLVFALVGALWSLGGLIAFPTWRWPLDEINGVLAWPFGLWLLALGLGELAGLPVVKTLTEGRRPIRLALALLIAGSYLAVCLRPLG